MICQAYRFFFILIIFYLGNQVLSSPVLLWSNVNLPETSVSLSAISSLHLISNSICKLTNEKIDLHLVVVKDLTIEDIQYGSQSDHSILLDAKKDKTKFRYYPNVVNDVYKTFSLIPQSNQMECSHIHFQLTSLVQYETLHEALNNIQSNIKEIKSDTANPTVIALISDSVNKERSLRQRRQIQNSDIKVLDSESCLFYAKELHWSKTNGTSDTQFYIPIFNESSCITSDTSANKTNASTTLNLTWRVANGSDTVNMTLVTQIIGRYWYITNATLNGNEYRYFAYGMHSLMDTPPTYCYVCNSASFVRYTKWLTSYGTYNFNDKFYIKDFQFQPFNGNGTFGQPNYCTSFFTSGIWMGITTSLICLGILLFGICRMMSIKTNDRFDDPKGKPLIIKAQE